MDPGQRGFGQQQRFNVPNLPFAGAGGAPPGGMPPRGPAGAGNAPFINQIQRLFPQGQMPPGMMELLMAILGGPGGQIRNAIGKASPQQGGGMAGPRRAMRGAQQGARGQQRPMGGQRPPMGGGGPRQRPPMGGGAPRQRPPMGGGRQPVVRMEDLVRALSGRGGGASQADLPVPQARR
jgi:hypothetical protein